jgi:O-succinylbenzoate synthase
MRRVVTERDEAKHKAALARTFVEEHFSYRAIQVRVIEKLNELAPLPRFVQPAYQPPQYTANTYTNTWNTATLNMRLTKIKINP